MKEIYTTSGTAPNFQLTIPNVTSLTDVVDKQIKIKLHVPIGFSTNATLNVNGLGAKGISNYNIQNTSFRISTLEGYVLTLLYNGVVFTLADFGDTNPISGSNVNQTVGGFKVYTNQVSVGNATGFGVSSSNGAIYTKQTNPVADVVGDFRIKAVDTTNGFNVQTCTVASPTKGNGTWKTIGQTASVNQLPYETIFTITPSTPINIGTRAVDLTPLFGAGIKTTQGGDLFKYESATGVIKFNSPSTDYTNFGIDLRVNGIIFASAGDYSQYRLYITRPDGVVNEQLPSIDCPKITGANASLTNTQLGTLRVRVLGATDPFVTQGFRIWAVKERGTDLQLTAGKQQQLLLLR